MKKYEYKLLYARVAVSMSAGDFQDWVFQRLNEWGQQGWHITTYQLPMTQNAARQQVATGEIIATGCRVILQGSITEGNGVTTDFLGEPPVVDEPRVEGGGLSIVQ